MAEKVKRRVAAARLAVAFVAAGTIAGATAWAQAGPPPTAQSSASDIFAKIGDIKGEFVDSANVDDGSLLFKDFKAGQVVASDVFVKYKKAITDFKQDVKVDNRTIKGELGDVKLQVGDIKTEVSGIKAELGSYIKGEQADARYIKLSDSVVRGDGSVFTATQEAGGQNPVPILSVPGLVSVEALPAEQSVRIKNIGSGNLAFSKCAGLNSGGVLTPGQTVTCAAGQETDVMQLIGVGSPETMTLNFTFFPAIQANTGLYTVQILVGL
jgi:hypothetical protein